MTKNSIIARPLFVLAAALVAAPLAAEVPLVVSGELQPVYRERVSFADLDLRHGAAQQKLTNRVKRASERVCRQVEGPFTEYGVSGYGSQDPSLTCADMTYGDARPQILAAIERAKSGQQQLATTLVIAGPAKAR